MAEQSKSLLQRLREMVMRPFSRGRVQPGAARRKDAGASGGRRLKAGNRRIRREGQGSESGAADATADRAIGKKGAPPLRRARPKKRR